MSSRRSHVASRTPPTPPNAASSTPSVMTCRPRRHPPAPMAARTANSRRRAMPRTMNRFATLTFAISSRRATAPASANNAGRTSPTIIDSIDRTDARTSRGSPGTYVLRARYPASSARACSARNARPEAADEVERPLPFVPGSLRHGHEHGHQRLGPARKFEPTRHDTDDSKRPPTPDALKHPAHDRGVASECTAPQGVADDGCVAAHQDVIAGGEHSPDGRADA